MFGHNNQDDENSTKDNNGSAHAEPAADGVLGQADAPVVPDGNTPSADTGAPVVAASDTSIVPSEPVTSPTAPAAGGSGDLLSIKQQALQQLSPLVDHLDQSPEERFRTVMMMIQASDNQGLVKNAYDII